MKNQRPKVFQTKRPRRRRYRPLILTYTETVPLEYANKSRKLFDDWAKAIIDNQSDQGSYEKESKLEQRYWRNRERYYDRLIAKQERADSSAGPVDPFKC